jgi:hypothetical protein
MISLTTDIIIQDGYYVCMYTAMYSVGTGISSTTGHAHHWQYCNFTFNRAMRTQYMYKYKGGRGAGGVVMNLYGVYVYTHIHGKD